MENNIIDYGDQKLSSNNVYTVKYHSWKLCV